MWGRYCLDTLITAYERNEPSQGHLYRSDATNLIDVAQHDLLDRLVLEDFAYDTAIAAANDEHLLGIWVARQRDMRDHLLVPNSSRLSTLPMRDV